VRTENAYAKRQIGAKVAALGVRHIRDHARNDAGLPKAKAYRASGYAMMRSSRTRRRCNTSSGEASAS
jgi:hypothetical protein